MITPPRSSGIMRRWHDNLTSYKALLCRVAIVAVALSWSATASAMSFEQVDDKLSAWHMQEAKQALDTFTREAGKDAAATLYLQARYAFLKGDYEGAAPLMERASEREQNPAIAEIWRTERDLIRSTHEVVSGYNAHTSPSGRFVLYMAPGKDEVLLPYAFDALDRAYTEVGAELGHFPETPIRVEVYPTTATLAKVSSLTEEDIRTSGTIALCKYNRLMITSPKALLARLRLGRHPRARVCPLRHQPQDLRTVCRSGCTRGSPNTLSAAGAALKHNICPPSSEKMLADRIDKDDLITFAQMHPSMAKLPSQEDAAVAFAEVYTVMEYLRERTGEGAFARVLDGINQGMDAPEAFAHALGVSSFARFERDWRTWLKVRPRPNLPDASGFEDELTFKDEPGATERDDVDLSSIPTPEARDHVHLGEMLQARGRWAAAVAQYRKAIHLMGTGNPVVQSRLATSLLEMNRAEDAREAILPARDGYPTFLGAWLQLGRAEIALKQWTQARDALEEAARINPFDPMVHTLLAQAYEALGERAKATEARKFANLVK